MFETWHKYLVALDEYPVENFHSILRARTNGTDSAEQIAFKAKKLIHVNMNYILLSLSLCHLKDSTMVPRQSMS